METRYIGVLLCWPWEFPTHLIHTYFVKEKSILCKLCVSVWNDCFLHPSFVSLPGDCDERIDEITAHIPSGNSVLSFCFADPFDLSIKFSSVERIAANRVDFLFVLALHMDAGRNVSHYASGDNPKIDEFLGLPNWRRKWQQAEGKGMAFPRFLAELFSKQMEGIGYLPVPFHQMKQIRSDVRNLPLYHLALFSKHQRAFDFWKEVLKYGTDQTSFNYDS